MTNTTGSEDTLIAKIQQGPTAIDLIEIIERLDGELSKTQTELSETKVKLEEAEEELSAAKAKISDLESQ